MRKIIRKIFYIAGNIIFIILLICLFQTIYSVYKNRTVSFFDFHIMRVLSNSMEPDIKVNTCVIVKETEIDDIEVGDIITFRSLETEIYGEYNTHRVCDIQVNERTGEKEFITKGDAFEYPDRLPVTYENILGKMYKKVPYSSKLSILLEKLANNKIYFVIIILPLVLCLLSYIYQLIRLIIYGADEDSSNLQDKDYPEKEVDRYETPYKS